jgi:integrase family protein
MNFTAHTFRHTYITELAKNGADLYLIQKLAGHSNINTTAHYLHSYDEQLSRTAELANFGI